ncbi:MAG: ribonuclease III [Oscillospiraceae bacterium]|jgi:ribonuclease-3|nr:ribonuclease III [Oscillospiraceae bacterium]MBQ5343172.1 ribonuclease III [Oscillospiraceae bacterium]MBR4798534.1 ribonuclease III [Oscillospiraceae bacterium]MBR4827279.1 ribonuclease III [Oscillospiraceae bacterium]MBR4928262.1 ribonuclease III [Oscillospiraceae bacterium]
MSDLEQRIGYIFEDRSLLEEALTHSSYANEHGLGRLGCNERLEFLGDAVLSAVVADHLYRTLPDVEEGELTKQRAAMVCESALAMFARDIDLGKDMRFGKGELKTHGNERDSILSDCFEAVIAAIYLDGGVEAARKFIARHVLQEASGAELSRDYKTELQEVIQQNPEEKLRYVHTAESGPDHDKTFTVEIWLNSNVIATATGHSKKQAEQNAAAEALRLMGLVK